MKNSKIEKLAGILGSAGPAVIAFSGGVDSSFLLYMAHKTHAGSVVAATVRTPYIPSREIEQATEFAGRYGIRHQIIDIGTPAIVANNPDNRCYHCKKAIFTRLAGFAESAGCATVFDGSNADDLNEYRPGMKALRELQVRSPLLEAGLTKNDIREHLRREGLDIWNMPAMTCMLTRIPHNTPVTPETLTMIEEAENCLCAKGYRGARVRVHADVARIECPQQLMDKICEAAERKQIVEKLKHAGFRYITLDMEGYRTGSMNL
ncbi:MAG: ATP-dependent sacrificial sulfur transferase LarE [Bacteroidales bacterium]|jgi:uncharacterized protein|nr:ATP-dependent sacrificial sulfur transferase LarE [Bacteroidales bacterium]